MKKPKTINCPVRVHQWRVTSHRDVTFPVYTMRPPLKENDKTFRSWEWQARDENGHTVTVKRYLYTANRGAHRTENWGVEASLTLTREERDGSAKSNITRAEFESAYRLAMAHIAKVRSL